MNTAQKIDLYELTTEQIRSVLQNETDRIAQMATINCILSHAFDYFFWTGFYQVISSEDTLKIGPYQGTLGCLTIPFSKGVCGACATQKQTIIVPNTHEFAGHIACDSRSNSEIVVPVFNAQKELIAVFDVDSTEYNSFCEVDQQYLEKILCEVFEK